MNRNRIQADCIPRWSWLKKEGRGFSFRFIEDLRYHQLLFCNRSHQALPSMVVTELALRRLLPIISLADQTLLRNLASPTKALESYAHQPFFPSHRSKTQPLSTLPAPGTLSNDTGTTSSHYNETKSSQSPQRQSNRRIPLPHRHISATFTTPCVSCIDSPPVC